jgi:5'-3' exonuclease
MKTKISNTEEKSKFDIIIIDGRNQVFKYQHTMKYLKNNRGIETGIYHGFLSLVLRLKQDNIKSRIIIAWEGGSLVRKQQLSTYKNGRPQLKNSFETKIKNLKNLLGMLGVEQKFAPGYEADDVSSTITKNNPKKRILLISEDRDWYQSMNKNICVMHKNKIYNYEDIKKQEGFNPEKFALYVLLKGKKGNNVEGIPYFPVKLAVKIVNESDSINDIIKYAKNHYLDNPKWMSIISDLEEDLKEKYEIVKLKNNVVMENVKCKKTNLVELKKILTELELFKVINLIKIIKKLKKLDK